MVWQTSPKRPAQASLAAFGTWRRVETRRRPEKGEMGRGEGGDRENGEEMERPDQFPKWLQRQHPISIKVTCACNAPHFAEVFRCCVHHTCFAQFCMLMRDPSQLPQSKVKALQTARHGVILALPLIPRAPESEVAPAQRLGIERQARRSRRLACVRNSRRARDSSSVGPGFREAASSLRDSRLKSGKRACLDDGSGTNARRATQTREARYWSALHVPGPNKLTFLSM